MRVSVTRSIFGSSMRQGNIMYPWLFNVYMDAVMKDVKMGRGRNIYEITSSSRTPNILIRTVLFELDWKGPRSRRDSKETKG